MGNTLSTPRCGYWWQAGWFIKIKGLKKSFANKLSPIKKSRVLPKQDLLNLYFKLMIPAVACTISVWGSTNLQDDLDSLERLHSRAMWSFRFSKDLQSVKVLLRAKWDTLRTYYKQSILKLTYKMGFNDSSSCMKAYISTLLQSNKPKVRNSTRTSSEWSISSE